MADKPTRIPRWLKIAIGMTLVLVAGYILIGEHLAGTSANAVINARVLVVRAPIDGELQVSAATVGSRLAQSEELATIVDPRPIETRLLDLQRDETDTRGEVDRLEAQLRAVTEALEKFRVQAAAYSQGRLKQLDARLAEAEATQEAAASRLKEAAEAFQRASELSARGVQSVASLDRARAEQEVRQQELQQALLRVRFLQIERESATKGTFLGDSYNDAPYSEQRIRELELRSAEIQAELAERKNRLLTIERQLAAERVRSAREKEGRLVTPAESVLWESLAGSGEYVRKGQDLFKLVECSTLMVTASVSESVYNSLSVGDPARFRLLGRSKVYEGSVIRLAGPGAGGVYGSLAIGPSREHLTRFDVALAIPGLLEDPGTSCEVGRTGRVVFTTGPLELWRRLMFQVGL